MKAEIYWVPVRSTGNFVWRWRTPDAKHASSRSFCFYFDCVQDARRNGHRVQLELAPRTSDRRVTDAANAG